MLDSIKRIYSFLTGFDTIYLYAADPGAFQVLAAIHEQCHDRLNLHWVMDGWCLSSQAERFPHLTGDAFLALEPGRGKTALLLGPQTDYARSRRVMASAAARGIESFFLFDHWSTHSYPVNFLDGESGCVLPDFFFALDEWTRECFAGEFSSLVPGCDLRSRIHVVGHPSVERQVAAIGAIPAAAIRAYRHRIGADSTPVVLLALEPIVADFGYDERHEPMLGYTEYSIMDSFFAGEWCRGATVLLRPHPRQGRAFAAEAMAKYGEHATAAKMVDTAGEDLNMLIAASDLVVGITSVVLVTALKAGKAVKSIQVGRNARGELLSNHFLEENLII